MRTITIIISGGVLQDIIGLPKDMDYVLCDHDDIESDDTVEHAEGCPEHA